MKKFFNLALATAAIAAVGIVSPALADCKKDDQLAMNMAKSKVMVEGAWARPSAKMAKNGAAYFTMTNHGAMADKLLSASTEVAQKTELHTHINDKGVMKMRPLKEPVVIEPGKSAAFAPGGHHVMLMGLKAPLTVGSHFPLTLTFEKAGAITVNVMVEKSGPTGAMHHGQH